MIPIHPKAIVSISVDGVSLVDILAERLISLTHTDNRGFEADTVDLELDDSDGKLALPPRGAELSLSLGWQHSGLVHKGKFTVAETAHSGVPDKLSIRATSADMASGLTTQRERPWDQTTIGKIVRTIASENDLQPVIHASLDQISIEHIDQTNESSANFLTRLAQRHDAIATVKNGNLLFVPAGAGITASGKEIPTVAIERKDGDHHQFAITDRVAYQGVRALYHDMDLAVKGEVIYGDVEDGIERGKPLPATTAPVTGQYKPVAKAYPSRPKALRAARVEWKRLKTNRAARGAYIGVRVKYNDKNLGVAGEVAYGQADDEKKLGSAKRQAAADADKLSSKSAFDRTADNVKTLRHVYASKANALRGARAEWRRLQRGVATFSIDKAIGLPEIYPETPVMVNGFKPQIDSTDWIVTRVTNTIDSDGGYRQRLEFEIRSI